MFVNYGMNYVNLIIQIGNNIPIDHIKAKHFISKDCFYYI
uniref:Uncharacterized protein n=1 Tax=Bartonella schoenbuchensis (strain DSM 13525 / NCTC 13165 / R1) TaxID=687861 RepID=E6Z0J8_BARSR|nr:hypothetical protein B11C_40493 [Bartonella schoenbuchensis R1]